MSLISLFVILWMVVLNAIFAGYEIALASVSVGRLKSLADSHAKGAKTALAMKQSMESSLAVVQLGITLVGAVAAATGGADASSAIAPGLQRELGLSPAVAEVLAVTIVVIPLSAVMIVAGELLPKVFALRNKEWVCLRISPIMRLLAYAMHPAVWVLEGSTRAILAWSERRWRPKDDGSHEGAEMQELRGVVALARSGRLIGGQEERIILGAARLSARPITEIMIPLDEVVTLDLQHTMAECLVLAHADMHTRFPVCSTPGERQSIIGYINFKDLVSELRISPQQPSIRGIVRAMPAIPAALSISSTMERLIREHVHIAVVRETGGAIIGMITLEDILEELVGDIEDEFDRVPIHVAVSGPGWVMGGGVTLERLESTTGAHIERSELPKDVHTLSGLIIARLKRVPRGGDILSFDGLRILVRKVRRQKVLEAQVSPHGKPIARPTPATDPDDLSPTPQQLRDNVAHRQP